MPFRVRAGPSKVVAMEAPVPGMPTRMAEMLPPTGELIGLSAADPLNLLGIVTPGARVPAILANRILFQDGMPIAILEGGKIRSVAEPEGKNERELELALLRRRLSPEMRLYYG